MLNEALRLFRVYNDMKITELSEQIGLSPSYISEIEKGRKTPSLAVVNKYADAFSIPASSILEFGEKLGEDEPGFKAFMARSIVHFLQTVEPHADQESL